MRIYEILRVHGVSDGAERLILNPVGICTSAVDEEGGSMRVKYQTLNKLIDYGLIREDEQKYKHNAKPLFCTEMGNIVGENLERIYQALPYKECSPDEYK